jgi:hypothetical protein
VFAVFTAPVLSGAFTAVRVFAEFTPPPLSDAFTAPGVLIGLPSR